MKRTQDSYNKARTASNKRFKADERHVLGVLTRLHKTASALLERDMRAQRYGKHGHAESFKLFKGQDALSSAVTELMRARRRAGLSR